MNYTELKAMMSEYRLGRYTHNEMAVALALWQLTEGGAYVHN